jgi:hypothetical protein
MYSISNNPFVTVTGFPFYVLLLLSCLVGMVTVVVEVVMIMVVRMAVVMMTAQAMTMFQATTNLAKS